MTKIIIFSPIKADATSYYRGWGPFLHLAKTRSDIELIDIGRPDMEISWAEITKGDILFMQRPSSFTEVRIAEIAKNCKIPLWIDYDDDYLNIPAHNPRSEVYAEPHRVEQIKRICQMADLISVSTPAIAKSISENLSIPEYRFHVVPNAVDELLFDTNPPEIHELGARDVILWRGGDTHDQDIAPYIDKMVALYNEYPQYRWAFMGNAPQEFLARIDNARILLYQWEDLFTYFKQVIELRPLITIVPLAKNKFNEAKSNCSWLESTSAWSAVVFPTWSTEFRPGMIGYEDSDSFYVATKHILDNQDDICPAIHSSIQTVHNSLTLAEANKKRLHIIWSLNMYSMLSPRNLDTDPVAPATDKQFFDYCVEHMHMPDNENYKNGHYGSAQLLLDRFKPNSIVEIGCGPGTMVEYFLDKRVLQVKGFDINQHFKDYFVKRNPHYADHYIVANISDGELDGVFDLCISCEVFEHIPADQCDALIEKLSHHFRYFYFTSTPYRSSREFDLFWGHKNIRTHELWIKAFEDRGWKYLDNPHILTAWDHVFMSTRHDATQPSSLPSASDEMLQLSAVSQPEVLQSVPETES